MAGSEPFPLLNTSAEQLHHVNAKANANADAGGSRRRRKSSALGGDIHAGDTGAPALASSRASLNANEKVTLPLLPLHRQLLFFFFPLLSPPRSVDTTG